jgi:hypothetical protein
MADKRNKQNSSKRGEACPGCGWSQRRSDCILCRECRRKHDEENIQALAVGGNFVDIFDHAEMTGRATLERLRGEHKRAEVLRQESSKALLERAENQLNANLAKQPGVRLTEGILYEAKKRIHQGLVDEDEDHRKVCRKAHGLKRAIESLELFLKELPEKREECKARQEEEEKEAANVA